MGKKEGPYVFFTLTNPKLFRMEWLDFMKNETISKVTVD